MSKTLELTQKLIACPSLTPDDAGCQTIIAQHLQTLGFKIEKLPFGNVQNLWARLGTEEPVFVFAGHTDVVPPGDETQWESPPFVATERNGNLYGRGVADMKGAIAAMLVATEDFLQSSPKSNPNFKGSIAFLITSDEEGPAIHGTAKVVNWLQDKNERITWCLVGEPSSDKQLGDTLKIGRRGSLSGKLTIIGKQGHIAYPHLAQNPIHQAFPALLELTRHNWDTHNKNETTPSSTTTATPTTAATATATTTTTTITAEFPTTSLQISNINAGLGVLNVTPETLVADFNFRYHPKTSAATLQHSLEKILQTHQLNYKLEWNHSGEPFFTQPQSQLVTACQQTVQKITGNAPTLSTAGGTSDGRFIAKLGAEIIELGLINANIHQVNEATPTADLDNLTKMYKEILEQLLRKS